MPTFLWSGKTASGQEEAERIDADSADEARKILEARGWTNLQQHTTEIHDFVKQQGAASSDPARKPNLTPKQELAFLQGTAPGPWSNWFQSIRESASTILVLVALLVWACCRPRTTANIAWIVVLAVMLVGIIFLFPVLHGWFSQTKDAFEKLHTARNWRRWNEVLDCLEKLKGAQRSTKIGIGEVEMARYRALAFAGLGRLDEAVSGYQAAAEKANMPEWLFHTHLATIYATAKEYDRRLESYRLALEEATDKSTVCLDSGMFLVQRFNRAEAKELLAQAETLQLAELARNYVPYLRGAIAFREKDFAAVDKNIREALAGFEARAAKKYYIFEPSLLICKGYLAVSCAALGKKDEARKLFAQSGKYLATICLDDLVEQYKASI